MLIIINNEEIYRIFISNVSILTFDTIISKQAKDIIQNDIDTKQKKYESEYSEEAVEELYKIIGNSNINQKSQNNDNKKKKKKKNKNKK